MQPGQSCACRPGTQDRNQDQRCEENGSSDDLHVGLLTFIFFILRVDELEASIVHVFSGVKPSRQY